jgi:hypothetical protein
MELAVHRVSGFRSERYRRSRSLPTPESGRKTGNGNGRYEPSSVNDQDPVPALIIGKADAAHTVHVFESQWDGFALIDKLALWPDIDSGEVAVIATRGAEISDRLSGINWRQGAVFYAYPQNDSAGAKWLNLSFQQPGIVTLCRSRPLTKISTNG